MHPRSRHWHLMDYVITRKVDRQDVCLTKAMCGAECWTDHRLIRSKLKIHILPKRRPQTNTTPKRLNVSQLTTDSTKDMFVNTLTDKLNQIELDDQDVEAAWRTLHSTVHSTAVECLGFPKRNHKDWFDENCTEIKQLLDQKHQAYKAHIDDPRSTSKKEGLKTARRLVQTQLRKMQDSWLSQKADEIQSYAERNDMKNFYKAIKEVYGPTTSGPTPLLSADGSTQILDKDEILKCF